MVLFTDGVTEAENEVRKEFGLDRLSDKLSSSLALGAEEFNERLLSDLDDFSSDSFKRDDVTILTVKRT